MTSKTEQEREMLIATLRKIYPEETVQMMIKVWGFDANKREGADND